MSKREFSIDCSAGGRTRQSFKDECDINKLMSKYQKTGAITHFAKHAPRYGFAAGVDFEEAMTIVAEGDSMFEDLPASLRKRFVTPGGFLDFVQDEANAEEMITLGLRDPEGASEVVEAPTVVEAPPVSPAAEAAAEASD